MRIVTALLLCLCLSVAVAAPSDRSYWMDVTGSIEIDAEGRVSSYFLDTSKHDAVEQALVRDMLQWRFQPVLVDGQPTGGKTSMRVQIEARPVDEGTYEARIVKAIFGAPERKMSKAVRPPLYPGEALRAGREARVVLVLQLDAGGAVERVHAEQVSLDRESKAAPRWRRLFEQSAAAAAMHWTFNINEFAAGEPVGVMVRISVEYSLGDGVKDDNMWRGYVAGPYSPVPWPSRGNALAQQGAESLKDGEVQPIDSLFRPAEAIIGRTL